MQAINMKISTTRALAVLALASLGNAQGVVNGQRTVLGRLTSSGPDSAVDFTAAGSTAPVKTGTLAARPASCTQGQVYFATDVPAGQNLYFCTVTGTPGTWTLQGGSGGATGNSSSCSLASSLGFQLNGTDEGPKMTATIAAFVAAGGGCLAIDSGKTLRVDSQIVTSPGSKYVPIRFTGDGLTAYGETGSTLDLRYASGPGIWANGSSTFSLDHLTVRNTVNCQPLLKATWAVLMIQNTTFVGSGTLKSACNDAIVLAGTNAATDPTINSAFNGYGTVIRDNHFYNTQRILLMQSGVNGIVFAGNSNQGGNTSSQGPVIESVGFGSGVNANRANVIRDNVIEGGAVDGAGWSTTYNCGIKLANTEYTVIEGNGYWDGHSGSFLCGTTTGIKNSVGRDNYLDVTGATFTDANWSANNNMPWRTIPFFFDGGGSALSGTITRCTSITFGGLINKFFVQADQAGNATITVKSVANGSYTGPGSASDISNGGEVMANAITKSDTTLAGWTTALAPDTTVCVSLSNPGTATWLSGYVRVHEGR